MAQAEEKSPIETSKSVEELQDARDVEFLQRPVFQETAEGLRARRKYAGINPFRYEACSNTFFRVDATVLPLLFLGLFVFQLDRMNLASALTDGFATDIGINQSTINIGNQLLFLFIVVLEIPSNMILQRVGQPGYLV
jgi:hypothetical protein